MSERSGLLTLADRLERLIHGNSALSSQPRRQARLERPSSAGKQLSASVATEVLPDGDPQPAASANCIVQTAPPPDPGAPRVLIAEADLLHREVLAHLVENAGYVVDCVDSADEVLLALESRPYAMVMLDCDSGGFQGMETAARIRLLDGAACRTPVIALIASGGEEQRKQRKAAGIDNYLAKPVLRESVETVLARYAPSERAEPLARYLALDRNRLLELEAASGDRAELFGRWIQMFLARAPEQLDQMRSAAEDGDLPKLCDASRKLKSLSGQIGALKVQETCGIIAAVCRTGSLAGGESLLPEASLALERAVRELHILETDLRAGRRLANSASARRTAIPARSTQVLVVEDDPLIARFLVSGLTGAGLPVTHLTGGRAALNALLERQFGAVVLNLDVSEVDGFSVLSEIRVSAQREVPVMIVSSRRQEQDILRAFELGADDYVTIPFNPLEIVVRLRRLLRQGVPAS